MRVRYHLFFFFFFSLNLFQITDSTSDQNVGLLGRIKFVISLQINENIWSDEKVFSTCFILIFGLIRLQIIDSTYDQNDIHLGYFNALLISHV